MRNVLIERRNIELTPDLAKHYLGFNTYKSQRVIRPNHVEELLDKMKDGRFRYGNIAFACLDNKLSSDVMMDGQHVCEAVIKFGKSVAAVMEKYKCPDEDHMATLYRQFNILQRSFSDCAKAKHFAMGFRWPMWITEKTLAALAVDFKLSSQSQSTISSIMGSPAGGGGVGGVTTGKQANFCKILFTLDQKTDLINDHIEDAEFLANLIRNVDGTWKSKATVKLIDKAIILMMMFRTRRISEENAFVFWTSLIEGEGLLSSSPIYHLREWLMRSRMATTTMNRSLIQNREFVSRITRAWNAYRNGGNPKSIYVREQAIPDLI